MTTLEQMQEAIGLEQFLNLLLPMEKKVWVYEKKCNAQGLRCKQIVEVQPS